LRQASYKKNLQEKRFSYKGLLLAAEESIQIVTGIPVHLELELNFAIWTKNIYFQIFELIYKKETI